MSGGFLKFEPDFNICDDLPSCIQVLLPCISNEEIMMALHQLSNIEPKINHLKRLYDACINALKFKNGAQATHMDETESDRWGINNDILHL